MSFEFPEMYLGTEVVASNDPSRTDQLLGWVVKVKNNAVDVGIIHEGGLTLKPDCWHADDPRCRELPASFERGEHGVFVLSEGEIQRRTLLKRLDAIEGKVAQLASQVFQMGDRLAAQSVPPVTPPDDPPRRKRGRPRNPAVLAGA